MRLAWAWGGPIGAGMGRDGTLDGATKVKGPTVVVTTNVGNASHPILVADTQPTRYVLGRYRLA